VGAFNLQGAAWDRRRRQFIQHDARPPALEAIVRPSDVEAFAAAPAAAARGLPESGSGAAGALADPAAAGGNGVGRSSFNGSAAGGAADADAAAAEPTWAAVSSDAPGELVRLRAHEGLPVRLDGARSPGHGRALLCSGPLLL